MAQLKKHLKVIFEPIEVLLKSPHIRYVLVGACLFVVLVVLIIRMIVFITGPEGEKWRAVGKTLNRPIPVDISPLRGTIYSSDNRPIAITAPVYRLYLDFRAGELELLHRPPKNKKEEDKKERIGQQLTKDLDSLAYSIERSFAERGIQVDRKKIRDHWRKGFLKKSQFTPVIHLDVTYLQVRSLERQAPLYPPIIDSITGKRARSSLLRPALILQERSKRINPFGSLALRTIGSVYGEKEGNLSKAKQGIELGFDSLLRGQVGKGIREYAAKQYNLITKEPAVDGYNVYTTLNMDIQSQLERIMRKQLGYFQATSGTAILMDVPTAKVLAVTNLMRMKDGSYVEGQNFAVSDMSEPGSTFKVASMLVALENKLIHPNDTIDVGNGIWQVGGRYVRDHNAHNGGYGRLSASQVIENSSNVGIAKIIQKHFASKPEEYVRQVRALAFGHDLRVEIPGSEQARIRMPQKNTWYGTTLAWMSFGYETQIPPMYTIAFFNAIANGGKLMKPYLVREVQDKNGQPIYEYKPRVIREQIASSESIQAIQEMLRLVVTQGTGKRTLRSDVVAISGKSGTAQIAKGGSYRGEDGVSHQVSFCGYFPSEAPRYTLMVVIREPSKEFAAGGGAMAGPVVRELAEAIVSMETPTSLDSIGLPNRHTHLKHWAIGRKSELADLANSIGANHKPNPRIRQEAYIRLDHQGKEHPVSNYPNGYVPNTLGMSAQDAHYLLMKRGYKPCYIGYGSVIEQSIPAGTKALAGTTITLKLGIP